MTNLDDVLAQIQAAGLLPETPLDIDTTRSVRCRVDGMGREKCGWYWLHRKLIQLENKDGSPGASVDVVVGAFGVYRGNDPGTQKVKVRIDGRAHKFSADEAEAIRARWAADQKRVEAERAREAENAARRAARVWAKALTAAPPDGAADYLVRKGVENYGLRYTESGALVVPMADVAGRIHGLQFILPSHHPRRQKTGRDKEYWPQGLAKHGRFHLIGSPAAAGVCLVAEGYATAATLHAATGLPVAVAFDAGNLLPVATSLAKAYKRARLLICADDDYTTSGNPGRTCAENAAMAVSGGWIAPVFADEKQVEARARIAECAPLPGSSGLTREEQSAAKGRVSTLLKQLGIGKETDFNDLQQSPGGGLAPVRSQIEAKLRELGWEARTQRAAAQQQGGGENGERPPARAVMDLDELVDRFVPIDDGTGEHVFDTWTRRIARSKQMLALLPAGVRGDDIKRHPAWVRRGAAYIDEIGFDPSGKDKSVRLNTWRGWPLQPKKGKCEQIVEHILNLIGDETNKYEVFDWLVRWMAYPLQHPGAKLSSAVIMHGPQGTGKSTVFQLLAKIYGDYSTVLNQRGLEDRFNADWTDSKLFILAEEVVARAEMWHIKNELKELVTGEWIRVNPKNLAAYRQRNQVNIVYLSNENQPLPIDNDDRRHLVVYNTPPFAPEYYDALWDEIEHGGVEAFYQWLLDLDLGDFHPKKRPPMTRAKLALVKLSKASEFRFVDEWAEGETEFPFCPCLSSDLYAAYLKWCRLNGEIRPRPSNHFHASVARLPGWEKKKYRVWDSAYYTGDTKPMTLVIPPAQALAVAGTAKKDADASAKWLTDCWLRFNNALAGANGGQNRAVA